MIDLHNAHHHVEFIDLPELKPHELFSLFQLSKFLEPYTNRLVMMCEIQTVSGNKIIRQEIKPSNVRAGDIPEIIGCSPMTANKTMRTFREMNIVKKSEGAFFVNPRFVRIHNSIATKNTVSIFDEHGSEQQVAAAADNTL